eukprot:jgi/Ulvmu1/12475/UM009_0127.1
MKPALPCEVGRASSSKRLNMFQHSPNGGSRSQPLAQAVSLPVRPTHASTQSLYPPMSHIARSLPRVSTSTSMSELSLSSQALVWDPRQAAVSPRSDRTSSSYDQPSQRHEASHAPRQRPPRGPRSRSSSPQPSPVPVNRPIATASPHPSRAPPHFRNKPLPSISTRDWVPNPPKSSAQAWIDWVATHTSKSLPPSVITKALRAFSSIAPSTNADVPELLSSVHTLLKACCDHPAANPEIVLDQAARSAFLQQHLHSHPQCVNAVLRLLNRAAACSSTFEDPLSISQLSVAQVRLRIACPLFWERLTTDARHHLPEYPMEQIANLAWAAAKLHVALEPPLAAALRGAALRVLPQCNPRNVTTLLWALATNASLRRPLDSAAPSQPQHPEDAWSTDEEQQPSMGDMHGAQRVASAVPSRWRHSMESRAAEGAAQLDVWVGVEEENMHMGAQGEECGLAELCDALMEAAVARAPEMAPRGLSACLWAIAALGRPQDSTAALAVAQHALAALPNLTARGTANVAWACARLKVHLTAAQASALADRAVHHCMRHMHADDHAPEIAEGLAPAAGSRDAFTALGFANTVWALGTLGVKRTCSFTDLAAMPDSAAGAAGERGGSHAHSMQSTHSAQDADSATGSASCGGADVHAAVHMTEVRSDRSTGSMHSTGSSMSSTESSAAERDPLAYDLSGLLVQPDVVVLDSANAATLQTEISAWPLLAAFRRLLPDAPVAELVLTCTGLSKLGISLPEAEQAMLLSCIGRHVTDFTAIEIAAVLMACSRMGMPWGVQQDALLATFVLHAATDARQGAETESDAESAAARVPPQATANVLWAATRGRGFVFDETDEGALGRVLESAVPRLNGQEVATVLWALGSGAHSVDGRLARLLQTAVRDTVHAMRAQELACACGGLVKTGMGLSLGLAGGADVWEEGGRSPHQTQGKVAVAEEVQGAVERLWEEFTAQTAAHVAWAVVDSGAVLTRVSALRALRAALASTAPAARDPMEAAIMLHSAAAHAAATVGWPEEQRLLDAQGQLLRALCAAVGRTALCASPVAVLCSLRALRRLVQLPAEADGGAAEALRLGGAATAAVAALREGVARHAAGLGWRDGVDAAEALVALGDAVPPELVASMCDREGRDVESRDVPEMFVMEDVEVAAVHDA